MDLNHCKDSTSQHMARFSPLSEKKTHMEDTVLAQSPTSIPGPAGPVARLGSVRPSALSSEAPQGRVSSALATLSVELFTAWID